MPMTFLRTIYQMKTGSHMLSFKKHSYTLFSTLKSGMRDVIKTKNQKEKENSYFLFYSQDTSCLENHPEAEPQFSLKCIYFQKQITIMTQWTNKIIENNLNRNVESISLKLFYKKGVLKNFTIFTGNCLCRSLSFDKVIKKNSRTDVFLRILQSF